jgi:hypothetical protein
MIIRKDSPFYGITEEEKERFLRTMEDDLSRPIRGLSPADEMAGEWENQTGRETTGKQVKQFIARLKLDRMLKDGTEEVDGLAERAKTGKARDGLIEAARQKLFEEALEKGNHDLMLELYRTAHEERAREREVEVSRRKATAAEENARTGRLRLELDAARSAMKLLPQLRELLTDGKTPAEERIARALQRWPEGRGLLLDAGKSDGAPNEAATS